MANTITNQENLTKARELLRSVRIKDGYGVEHQIGFINFQTFTDKQVTKKGDEALEHTTTITASEKYGKTFYSLNANVHIEKKDPKQKEKDEAIIALLDVYRDNCLAEGVDELVRIIFDLEKRK